MTVTVQKPVKGLLLRVEGSGEDVTWSDNGIDVFPGDPQTVNVTVHHELSAKEQRQGLVVAYRYFDNVV